MPVTRTPKASTSARTLDRDSNTKPKSKSRDGHKSSTAEVGSTQGVQKIKAALRQTTRLLAKENLAADTRVAAERRRDALQDELVHAQSSRVERQNASKYHMVKFFERQKIVRRIAQAKKTGDADALRERRVDLNYILHYPNSEKYISLLKIGTDERVNARRAALRVEVGRRMDSGEIPAEPERSGPKQKRATAKRDNKDNEAQTQTRTAGVKGDAFFGDDNEDDEAEDAGLGDGGDDQDQDNDEDEDEDTNE